MDSSLLGVPFIVLGYVEHELLLFAAFWFAVGAIDDFGIDLLWLWLRLTGRVRTGRVSSEPAPPLRGVAAVLVPAWREATVVCAMLRHTLKVWPQADLRIYAGCYRNDPTTLAALMAVGHDPRLRVVVHDRDGPTTKADCLNRLFAALVADEARGDFRARSIILHDAEDMVHPAALTLLDLHLDDADFVQLPVRPEPQSCSPWIGGHYCDEFAESHGKAMVVRDWLGAGLPAAGVGCAFSRDIVDAIAVRRGTREPFAPDALTEDYECGLLVRETGGKSRFLRMRDEQGALVATREFFPTQLVPAVRQKTRWLHGIAFQGWERLGWTRDAIELWMRMRDRRGPLVVLVLTAAYLLILIVPVMWVACWIGLYDPLPPSAALKGLLALNLCSLIWRGAARAAFTCREYGLKQGALSIVRTPVSNVIAIMAGRRAFAAYMNTLRGGDLTWEHTVHIKHPAMVASA